MQPRSAACSGRTIHCCRTISGSPSAITAAVHPSACRGRGFRRPQGQRLAAGGGVPSVGPSARLDYELELGVFIGAGNALGSPIPMADAEDHIFGMCLLNDWSARDIQAWEYQPLGPFLSKSFATTISPWVVTLPALAPFRLPFNRPAGILSPCHTWTPRQPRGGCHRHKARSLLQSAKMRERGEPPQRFSATSFRHSYWTISQLVAHHTVNGCNLRPGDFFGSGTQSGPTPGEAGSLVELSKGGTQPLAIGKDEHRTFLEDGDSRDFPRLVRASRRSKHRIRRGFGQVLPARLRKDSGSQALRLDAAPTLLSALFLQP